MSEEIKTKIPFEIVSDPAEASKLVADKIAELIRVRTQEGKQCVLGLATGSTPIGVYSELIRKHKEEGLSFSNVVTFNLDEYFPMHPESLSGSIRMETAAI